MLNFYIYILAPQLSKFCVENFDDYEGSESEESFFTAAERSYLMNACLQTLEYSKVINYAVTTIYLSCKQ